MTNAAGTLTAQSTEWNLPSRGHIGMACLILTESALFTILVVAYLFYIGKSLSGPYPNEVLELPILATICLLSSSFTITMAERALRKEHVNLFSLGFSMWWLLTILLGAFFLGFTAYEWYGLIYEHNLTISSSLFGTTFYTLVGFHAGHVTAGLILLTFVFILATRGHVHKAHAPRIEVLGYYWHFVDAIWVVVFTTVYIIGR